MDANHQHPRCRYPPPTPVRVLKFKNRYFVKFRGPGGEEKYHILKMLSNIDSVAVISNRGADITSRGCRIITTVGGCPTPDVVGSVRGYSNYFIDMTRAKPASKVKLSNRGISVTADLECNIELSSTVWPSETSDSSRQQIIPTANDSQEPTRATRSVYKPRNNSGRQIVQRANTTNLLYLNQNSNKASRLLNNNRGQVNSRGIDAKNSRLKRRIAKKREKIKIHIQTHKKKKNRGKLIKT